MFVNHVTVLKIVAVMSYAGFKFVPNFLSTGPNKQIFYVLIRFCDVNRGYATGFG